MTQAILTTRVDSHDAQFKWIWGTATTAFLGVCATLWAHVRFQVGR
jgi:hypothetical protein